MASPRALYISIAISLVMIIIIGYVSYVTLMTSKSTEELRSQISESIESLRKDIQSLKDELNRINDLLKGQEVKVASISENLTKRLSGIESQLNSSMLVLENLASTITKLKLNVTKLSEALNVLKQLSLGFPVMLVDALNRTVIIDHEPMRIVSCAPSITEILFAIGASNKVIGVDQFSNYPPEVIELVNQGKIAVIGGFSDLDIEKIIELSPDLIILTRGVQDRYVPKLEELGFTVLVITEESYSHVLSSILMIGRATGNYKEAAKLVSNIAQEVNKIRKTVSNLPKPKVLVIVWPEPIFVAGSRTWLNELISFAGGVNVFNNTKTPYPMVSVEEILTREPEVLIVTMTELFNSTEDFIKWVKDKNLDTLPAIKNGRFYTVMDVYNDVLVRPGPRVVDALKLLARILHPEIYGISVNQIPHILSPETFRIGD